MKEKELRRTMPLFIIGTMMQWTDLTGRQIRYYVEQELVHPHRTETNRRIFSLNDVDWLLEVKDYLVEGFNITAIRRLYESKETEKSDSRDHTDKKGESLTDDDVLRILYKEILSASSFNPRDKNNWPK